MVVCTFGSGGWVGYHQATRLQLSLVVQSEGWVREEKPERFDISVGRAAFWEGGDWHEAGTDIGRVAIVIKSESFESKFVLEA